MFHRETQTCELPFLASQLTYWKSTKIVCCQCHKRHRNLIPCGGSVTQISAKLYQLVVSSFCAVFALTDTDKAIPVSLGISKYIIIRHYQIGKHPDGLCANCNKPETVTHFLTECWHNKTCSAVLAACNRLNLSPAIENILSDGRLHNVIISSLRRKI